MKPGTPAKLEQGRSLFNAGKFFEAHEVWEEAWLAEDGPPRRLLQGLIQITAGFYKAIEQRQPQGCVRLLEAGLDKLSGSGHDEAGLDLAGFKQAVRASLEEARSWEQGVSEAFLAERAPRLGTIKGVKS